MSEGQRGQAWETPNKHALLDIGEHWRDMYFHIVCHCFVGDYSYNSNDITERYLFSIYV
jgi:hypothetical protein